MSRAITGKRVKFEVDFYWRGKRKTPSIGISDAGDDDAFIGLPTDWPEFVAFEKACRTLCAALIAHGDLD